VGAGPEAQTDRYDEAMGCALEDWANVRCWALQSQRVRAT
jgi:hypothetical protein